MTVSSLPLVKATREVAPWIEVLARIGFVAKGVLYLTTSTLAVRAALGFGGKANPDSRHAMRTLESAPLGSWLLVVLAVGLVGYAAWRIVEALTDAEQHGRGAKGLAIRASHFGSGLVHLGLAYAAAVIAFHIHKYDGRSGAQIQEAVGKALSTPGGVYAVYAAGAIVAGYGLYQLWVAYRAKLPRDLHFAPKHTVLVQISRIGIAARAIVFVAIAWLVAHAARDNNPREAGGIGDSLHTLKQSIGRWPFIAIALGLGAYGIYELINAKYRRVRVSA
jgi:hypothetical protein